jgi:hypothetical protein
MTLAQEQWIEGLRPVGVEIVSDAAAELPQDGKVPDEVVWLMPLDTCPARIPPQLAIAALSPRDEAHFGLCIPASEQDPSLRPPFRSGGHVRVEDELWQAYMREVRPDALVSSSEGPICITRSNRCDLNTANSLFFPFSQREFPARPGSGIIACIISREAAALRKSLAAHHQKEVSRLSNLERGLLQKFTEKGIRIVGIHAQEDTSRHIQLSMAWPDTASGCIRRKVVSSSSHLGLVEHAWAATGL